MRTMRTKISKVMLIGHCRNDRFEFQRVTTFYQKVFGVKKFEYKQGYIVFNLNRFVVVRIYFHTDRTGEDVWNLVGAYPNEHLVLEHGGTFSARRQDGYCCVQDPAGNIIFIYKN